MPRWSQSAQPGLGTDTSPFAPGPIQGEGSHYEIIAIGEMFEGLRPVRKQQLVYGGLSDCIADGSVHAVNIRTFTPAEWQAQPRD